MSKSKKTYGKEVSKLSYKDECAYDIYEDEFAEIRLFPDEFAGSTASATECTGLIQVAPVTPELQETYDSVYSYRQKKPRKGEKKDKN
ncbi:MAG: hypothetical protein J6D15_02295 [Clostridia bacterium]|nr:hypothetical protein [Clostridia bacterium]